MALAAVLALSACSSEPDFEPREMWEGVRYDRPLTVDELVDLGWRCGRDTFSVADDYDSACGTRIDPANNPFFTVFGVPHAGSTVFLKQGRLKGMNIGIHATSAELVASHMARIFGRPDVLANPIGCDLHWSVRGTEYRLELSDGTQDAFVSLFVQLGSRLPDGETLGFGTRLWKKITGSPCGRFP